MRLEGVSKRWGEATVVDRVDLEVAAGSFCVVLGPSGCGKTTCLRIIAGLEAPTEGRVIIAGRDVTRLPPAARGVAMVFQSYALFPHLTVAENIVFGLRARSVARAEREARLAQAADMLGLGPLLHRRPAQLSGGQQQRVALGRAVVAQASVCLMDEPLSNLDALLRAEMRREILELQRRLGLTMIYVTHDQTEAMSMADQVVLMHRGQIEQSGAAGRTLPAPRDAVRRLFHRPAADEPAQARSRAQRLPSAGHERPRPVSRPGRRRRGRHPARGAPPRRAGIPARVLLAEYLGAETVLSCEAAGQRILARIPGRSALLPGADLHLAFDPADLHLFSPSGQTLEPAASQHQQETTA